AAVLAAAGGSGKRGGRREKGSFCRRNDNQALAFADFAKQLEWKLCCARFEMATGFFGMTRFSATIAILACLTCSILLPAHSQSNNRSISTDNGCFPWQDFKNGQCVTRPSAPTPGPGPAPAAAEPPTIVAAPPMPPQPPVPPPLPPSPPSPPVQVVSPPAPPAPVCPLSTHYDAASGR